MAYGLKYSGGTTDIIGNDWTVNIYEAGYTGNIININLAGESPISILYNRKDRIYSKTVKLLIINDLADQFEFAKLNQAEYQNFKLQLLKNGNLYFQGYLLPATFNQTLQKNKNITLTFTNGLTQLQYLTPDFLLNGTDINDIDCISEIDAISNILSGLTWNYPIYTNSTLRENTLNSSQKDDNPFKYIYLNKKAFQKNNKNDNSHVVFNKILDSYNMDLYEIAEKWYIDRFPDRGGYDATNTIDYYEYDVTGDTYQKNTETKSFINLDSILYNDNINYGVNSPLKEYNLKLDTKSYYLNLVSSNIDDWVKNGLTTNQYYNIGNINTGFVFVAPASTDNVYTYGQISNNNDDIKITAKYKIYKWYNVGEKIIFRYAISLQKSFVDYEYYIKDDGTLTTTETVLEKEVTNSENLAKYNANISVSYDTSGNLDAVSLTDNIIINLYIYKTKWVHTDSSFEYVNPVVGDFELTVNTPAIDNLYIADFQNNQIKKTDNTIYLYDTDYINFYQSKYLFQGYTNTSSWSDKYLSGRTLQEHYIYDAGQLYNSGCPIFRFEINDDNKDIEINDLFETSYLKDDLGNNMKFYITKYEYDVSNHIYKLQISKWINTIGKNIG